MPEKREMRLARFRCLDNDHRFVKTVRQVGQTVEEQAEAFNWRVENPDSVRCKQCGSPVEVLDPR
jgi:hypothetical protein